MSLKREHSDQVVLRFVKVSGAAVVRPSQRVFKAVGFPIKHPCHQNISLDNCLLVTLLLKYIECKRKSKVVESSKVMGRSNLAPGLFMLCTVFQAY